MKSRMFAALFAVAVGTGGWSLSGGAAAAQQAGTETQCVSSQTDWNVCLWDEPKECWGVSKPKETVNTRDGQPAQVSRSAILLFVTFRPGSGVAGEVSFTGGYPFAPGSTVGVDIDGTTYEMTTDGEWAWPSDPAQDAAMLASMKAGAQAILTARSARGTQTRDTFSLLGFTAAVTEAENRCK